MTLTVEYRHSTRDGGPWLSRTIEGEAAEWVCKLIHAGRVGVRGAELPLDVLNLMKTASIPVEHFTAGSEGSGMHRRIRISPAWSYRLADQDAAAA